MFVVQIITFLLSFTNGWLYYTWVMAGWLQYWYGWPHESYGLKTGQEQLAVLPPMSPVEGGGVRFSNSNNRGFGERSGSRRNSLGNSNGNNNFYTQKEMIAGIEAVGPSTPMLGSGLRWNKNENNANNNNFNQPSPTHSGDSQFQQQQQQPRRSNSRPNTPTRNRPYDFDNPNSFNNPSQFSGSSQQQAEDNILFSSQMRVDAPNSGLRRSNPPGAFVGGNNNNNDNNAMVMSPRGSAQNNYNQREASQNNFRKNGIRPVNVIEGLEDEQQQQQNTLGSSTTRTSGLYFPNLQQQQQQPVSLMTSPTQSNAGSRIRVSNAGNYASPASSSTASSSNFNNNNQNWRDLPVVNNNNNNEGQNSGGIMWNNNRRMML